MENAVIESVIKRHHRLIERTVSGEAKVMDYLREYDDIVAQLREIGEVCDSPEDLRISMIPYLQFPAGSRAKSFADHEAQHGLLAAEYGIESKFMFFPGFNGACTIFSDLSSKAELWSHEMLKEFNLHTLQVRDPSQVDRAEYGLWSR